MNILLSLIKKGKPFSILILGLTMPSYGQNLQNIYEENFREGSALPVNQVLELKNNIVETNINDLSFWGNIAISTILAYPMNINEPEFITLKRELIQVFNTLYKIKYRDIPINQLFNLGMFGYNMMAVYKELAISMFKPYYFSKDIFLYILSKYKNTPYYLSSQMMLAIYLTFPANHSTINFNQVINKTLSETAINNLQDPFIKYLAYVYKSMFFMKIDQYQNAHITLKKAENIFPKATLHQLIYGLWSIDKDGF